MHCLRPKGWLLFLGAAAAVVLVGGPRVWGACCYFSAKNADILQPAQKVFITWDPVKKMESFTVQPKFEGNALDFGMVIPTPSQPKLHEMPRDFFKHLAIYSIMKKREFARSKLLPVLYPPRAGAPGGFGGRGLALERADRSAPRKPAIKILEAGIVGSLDYKIIEAGRADDLFKWLKDNEYSYAGDRSTLDFYVKKKWIFTVMKIDTMQMKKNKDGSYAGNVTPTRFSFASEKLVYPLKITQISVKDKTEALFYVQAPYKVDLQGDMSYQNTWIPMLNGARGCSGGIPGGGAQWLAKCQAWMPALMRRNQQLGFRFVPGQRPQPNAKGIIPTTMEWARRLTKEDIAVLTGKAPYSETVPNVDEGFTKADLKDPKRREAVIRVIRARLAKARQERPLGYLVRHAPKEDTDQLRHLIGHLHAGLFITKFRKTFTRGEMNDDLLIVPARHNDDVDTSEYTEQLPTSPP